jgi:hypothetical protein
MKKVLNINTISEYNAIAEHKTLHPLVSIIDFSRIKPTFKPEKKKPDVHL